jgi:hypothetical protein
LSSFSSDSAQWISVPISFLSLSFCSTKLFFAQRLGGFADVEPPLKFLFFIFPFVILQTLGYVFSLVLCSVYLRPYTFVCIVLLIVSASLHVLCRHLLSMDKGLQFLYQRARFIYIYIIYFLLDFGDGKLISFNKFNFWNLVLVSLHFSLSYEAGFYVPTILKLQPPLCMITAHATLVVYLFHNLRFKLMVHDKWSL